MSLTKKRKSNRNKSARQNKNKKQNKPAKEPVQEEREEGFKQQCHPQKKTTETKHRDKKQKAPSKRSEEQEQMRGPFQTAMSPTKENNRDKKQFLLLICYGPVSVFYGPVSVFRPQSLIFFLKGRLICFSMGSRTP